VFGVLRRLGACHGAAQNLQKENDMEINATAPIVSRHDIVVQAPVETVWAAHTRINEWPRWQADITRAALAGSLTSGSTFSWETAGLDIVSVIDDVESHRRIAWHGEANGILGIHVWTFSPNGHDTLVTTEESWEGPALPSDVGELKRALDISLERWLWFLKARVES
jgi:hypothetical protein